MTGLEKLPISRNTVNEYIESHRELNHCIYDEVSIGNLSKESYLLDFIYDEKDHDYVKNLFEQALQPRTHDYARLHAITNGRLTQQQLEDLVKEIER